MHYLGTTITSPIGPLLLLADERACLRRISFLKQEPTEAAVADLETQGHSFAEDPAAVAEAVAQLAAYFAGELRRFELAMEPEGSDFQRRVWSALLEIPYGECRAYRDIAAAIGDPGAVRAVGTANNRNPIPIIIPCHRVLGAGGDLVGYGGGTEIKHQLLVHEGYFLC